MSNYLTQLNDGGKEATCETMEEALEYIATNFRTAADDLGTWEDADGQILVWMTEEAKDEATDNSDVIATITAIED